VGAANLTRVGTAAIGCPPSAARHDSYQGVASEPISTALAAEIE
jgi:hypothetical protein